MGTWSMNPLDDFDATSVASCSADQPTRLIASEITPATPNKLVTNSPVEPIQSNENGIVD